MNEDQIRLRKLSKESRRFYKGAYYDESKQRYIRVGINPVNARFAKKRASRRIRRSGVDYNGKTAKYKREHPVWGWY